MFFYNSVCEESDNSRLFIKLSLKSNQYEAYFVEKGSIISPKTIATTDLF